MMLIDDGRRRRPQEWDGERERSRRTMLSEREDLSVESTMVSMWTAREREEGRGERGEGKGERGEKRILTDVN